MNRLRLIYYAAGLAILVVAVFVICGLTRQQTHIRARAEGFALDQIKHGIEKLLSNGAPVPTNWTQLSSNVDWGKVTAICERNHLSSISNSYALIERKIPQPMHPDRLVFMLRKAPTTLSGGRVGRWGLSTYSNVVFRIWLTEAEIGPSLRSQIGATQDASKTP